jgi:hypothetical protein
MTKHSSRRHRKCNTRKCHKKQKHHKKTRHSRRNKQKGGACYGSGVGSNNYDPNLSVYNTRALQLFPYKPTQ